MSKKQYLNEEQYQKTKKKFNIIGTTMLIVGAIMLIFGFVMAFGFNKLDFFFFAVIGMALVGFGTIVKMISNGREINAFLTQQQMPIAQEGIDKMAPTVGKAAGTIGKELAKGIKEGIKEEDKK